MALPFFQEFGWEPLILKINPDEQEGIKDELLCRTVPANTREWQAGCLPLSTTSWTGLRNVGLRSFFHLQKLGSRIIRQEKPKAVFFSTTMFALMTLGSHWLRQTGVPFVLDFQDPWVREKVNNGTSSGSGSRGMKARVAEMMAEYLEPKALREVSHVVSVSPAYVTMLGSRYSRLRPEQFTVLPFGAAEKDYEILRELRIEQKVFNAKDGKQHWVYAGVFIDRMNLALRSLFAALVRVFDSQPDLRSKVRLHFIGTNYAPKDRASKTVEPIAREFGLLDVVEEITDRLPYFEALQCLLDADALIVPGLDDPGYTASKIYPYILARKPMLAIFHENSSVVDVLTKTKAGTVIGFKSGESHETIAPRILESNWLNSVLKSPGSMAPTVDWTAFEPYTAREMTRKLCSVFDKVADGR